MTWTGSLPEGTTLSPFRSRWLGVPARETTCSVRRGFSIRLLPKTAGRGFDSWPFRIVPSGRSHARKPRRSSQEQRRRDAARILAMVLATAGRDFDVSSGRGSWRPSVCAVLPTKAAREAVTARASTDACR